MKQPSEFAPNPQLYTKKSAGPSKNFGEKMGYTSNPLADTLNLQLKESVVLPWCEVDFDPC